MNGRLGQILQGGFAALLLALFGAAASQGLFSAELGRSFIHVGRGELLFWLAFCLLLLPGLLLLVGLLPLEKGLAALAPLFAGKGPRLFGWGLLLVLLVAGGARWGRALVLADLPVTVDEQMVLFGARMVAAGDFWVPAWDARLGFSNRYLYMEHGRFAAMDFPGTIVFRAAGLRLGLGSWPFALLAACSGWALAQALGEREGRRGALLAGLAWLLSPMVVALSLTEHAHLLSRSLIALAWALYLRLEARPAGEPARALAHAACGLLFALAFLTRPAEALAAFAPLLLHLLLRCRGRAGLAAATAMAAAAAVGPLTLLLYNQAVTGSPWVLPRVVATARLLAKSTFATYWERLGSNFGFNLLMLVIFFLGPLTLAILAAAWRCPAAPVRVAFAALGLHFLVALAHDDTGIHLVGPIHYSEAAVPLVVLTVFALPRLLLLLGRCGVPPLRAAALGVALAAGQLVFLAVQAGILADQARIQLLFYDVVSDLPPAVVIADPLWRLWETRPELAAGGTWLADLPQPDPYFRDRVLFAQVDRADPELLRRTFPDRAFYRLSLAAEGPPWRLEALPRGAVKSAAALDTMPPPLTESGVPDEDR